MCNGICFTLAAEWYNSLLSEEVAQTIVTILSWLSWPGVPYETVILEFLIGAQISSITGYRQSLNFELHPSFKCLRFCPSITCRLSKTKYWLFQSCTSVHVTHSNNSFNQYLQIVHHFRSSGNSSSFSFLSSSVDHFFVAESIHRVATLGDSSVHSFHWVPNF